MRITSLAILFISFVAQCNAQTPVLTLLDRDPLNIIENAYYKDTENMFNKFVGIWKYQETNKEFTIELKKKLMFHEIDTNYYEDIIIGEYKYVENGIVIVNTLSNININHNSQFLYNISGYIIENRYTEESNSRPIKLFFNDPEREYLNRSIIVKYIPAEGSIPEKIEVEFTGDTSIVFEDNLPLTLRVPEQNYILEKQP